MHRRGNREGLKVPMSAFGVKRTSLGRRHDHAHLALPNYLVGCGELAKKRKEKREQKQQAVDRQSEAMKPISPKFFVLAHARIDSNYVITDPAHDSGAPLETA
jgi:hypothetical protein